MENHEVLSFVESFVENFYQGIEKDFLNIMKKEKVTKLSVGKYQIDGADYLDNSKSPIIETIKKTDEGLKIYYKNKEIAPSSYNVDEIFHTFSLAELGDTLTKKGKYIKLLNEFYSKAEEVLKDILKEHDLVTFEFEDEEIDILAIHSDGEKYSLVQGVLKEITLKDDRIFFLIQDEELVKTYAHIVGVDAGDLAFVIKELI